MNAFKSTVLHIIELAVCLGAAYLVLSFYDVDSETRTGILGLVLSGLAKFARASESVPVDDYINK